MRDKERKEVLEQILKPSVRVVAKKALGSGTVVYSKGGETYLLTNHHVIGGNIEYKDIWDGVIRKSIKKDFTSPVEVQMGRFDENGVYLASTSVQADIVAYSEQQDLALLKLRDKVDYPVVNLYPKAKTETVPLLVDLVCCGCALGEKPVITFGNLNGIQIEIDNEDFWLSTAPSIFGNSGGSVYAKDEGTWKFLGIPSRIPVIPIGYGGNAITHLGFFIPAYRVYRWLENEVYNFVYDKTLTPADCEKMREEKKEKELAVYMRRKG